MSTSQLHLCRHLGSPSLSTQGIIHPVMVGNQDPQPPQLPMEPTMAQYQAISKHLPQVCFQVSFELRMGISSVQVGWYCSTYAA